MPGPEAPIVFSGMRRRVDTVLTWSKSTEGQKWVRYSMVSVIAVIISQALLAFAFGVVHWSARWANVFAVGVSAIPSYYLNRAWVWGKRGRSHLMKEVIPFWSMAFIGLVFSTITADLAERWAAKNIDSHLITTGVVMAASLAAFGILWGVKFVILNKLMFVHRGEELPAALDGS